MCEELIHAMPGDRLFRHTILANKGTSIKNGDPHAKKLCFIGYPCDEGLVRNKLISGASKGPSMFREYMTRRAYPLTNREYDVDMSSMVIKDFGDAEGKNLEEMQDSMSTLCKEALDQGFVTISVGGCRDQSYPHAKALLEHSDERVVNVISVDAHMAADKLQKGTIRHSCSPFYLLLHDQQFKGKFVEFASQLNCCGSSNVLNVKGKNGRIFWLSTLRETEGGPVAMFKKLLAELSARGDESIYISFDLDSIRNSDCPGVTLPSFVGLTNEEATEIFLAAGRCPSVKAMDISEFNPTVEEVRTGKLVAHLFYHFAVGYAQRKC